MEKVKRYWLRGLVAGLSLILVQVVLYVRCLPTENGPYGLCGMIFVFPLGIILDDLLRNILIPSSWRIPTLILIEVLVIGGLFSWVGYLYGRKKSGKKG
jgi:hypothetical protein